MSRGAMTVSDERRPLLQVERLSQVFLRSRGWLSRPTPWPAVDRVSFYVKTGEILAIVGESGSGKSTLALTVAYLLRPTTGRVFFAEKELGELSGEELRLLRQRLQMVVQDPSGALNPWMSIEASMMEVFDNFKLLPRREERRDKIVEWLQKVGLDESVLGRVPGQLSGGEQRRVALLRSLILSPSLVLLDETLANLDVSHQSEMLRIIADVRDTQQTSFVLISHDLGLVGAGADRVAVMFGGRIVEIGPTRQLLASPQHPYTQLLVSASRLDTHVDPKVDPALDARTGTGCVFEPRCPVRRSGKCEVDRPRLLESTLGARHRVACFFPSAGAIAETEPAEGVEK